MVKVTEFAVHRFSLRLGRADHAGEARIIQGVDQSEEGGDNNIRQKA